MGLAKCCSQTDGYLQLATQIDRLFLVLLDDPLQGFTTGLLKEGLDTQAFTLWKRALDDQLDLKSKAEG